MTAYADAWYLCELDEAAETTEAEPDWSRVPEAKRDAVRKRWRAARTTQVKSRVQLWGPQIAFFERQPGYRVTVIGPASATQPEEARHAGT